MNKILYSEEAKIKTATPKVASSDGWFMKCTPFIESTLEQPHADSVTQFEMKFSWINQETMKNAFLSIISKRFLSAHRGFAIMLKLCGSEPMSL